MKLNYYKIQITHLCNDNCLFCYDKWSKKYWKVSHYDFSQSNILKSIKKWYKKGFLNHIVFTGWEATIDKNIIKYVSYAKDIWFDKIELISNWVRFFDRNFTQKILWAWLTWVNISIHWHNERLHNYLTWNKKAFQSLLRWIINIKKINKNFHISVYIIINSLNLLFINNIILLFSKLWVSHFDLLQLIPFWNALKNKKIFINNEEDLFKVIDKVLSNNKGKNISASHLLHPNMLEWHKDKIPLLENILWDININLWMNWEQAFYNNEFSRCNNWYFCKYCYLNPFCSQIESSRKNIWINKTTKLEYIPFFNLPNTYGDFLSKLHFIKDSLKPVNLPYCILWEESFYDNFLFYTNFFKKEYNYTNFKEYFKQQWYLIKSLRCKDCKYYKSCKGVHIEFIRKYGFKTLVPILL